MKSLIAAVVLGVVAVGAQAQMSPVGLWKQYEEDGKTAKAMVRITESAGVATGKIDRLVDPAKQDAKCDECKDERKGKPVAGMEIIRNVKQDSDDKTIWAGGEIMRPSDGKTFKPRLRLIEGGKKLEVRGYVGFIYKTQVWERVE
jgi:uncharacterized protein (DUF2147 family)